MLTDAQKEVRRTRIGASEIAAVLGMDPWRTPLKLFTDKMHPARRVEADDHRSWGNDVEGAILRNYARRAGYTLLASPGTLVHPAKSHLCATPDAIAALVPDGAVRGVQAKNVEEHHATAWGEPGTPQVPANYYAQVTIEIGVLLAQPDQEAESTADIAVSFGGRPPLGYPIPFNAELFGNLSAAAERFVRDHLATGKPPPLEGDRAAMEYVKRRFFSPTGEVKPSTPEAQHLARLLRSAKADLATHEARVEEMQAELCALVGDAYGIDGVCTWAVVKEQRVRVTDYPLVLERLAGAKNIPRAEIREVVEEFTHEEVVKQAHRRLTLAKERKTT